MLDQLKELLRRHPFAEFQLVTTSGDRYTVESSHQVAIGETFWFYCYPRSDKSAYVRLIQLFGMLTFEA